MSKKGYIIQGQDPSEGIVPTMILGVEFFITIGRKVVVCPRSKWGHFEYRPDICGSENLMETKRIQLSIESSYQHVPLVSVAVNNLCSLLPLSGKDAHGVELCTTEAVVNSIKHAYGDEPDHEVTVTVTMASDRLVIDVCDWGKPMAPGMLERKREIGTAFDFDKIDTIPESGRGLAIIQWVMDEVCYTTAGPKNCLRMVKKIPAE